MERRGGGGGGGSECSRFHMPRYERKLPQKIGTDTATDTDGPKDRQSVRRHIDFLDKYLIKTHSSAASGSDMCHIPISQ